MGNGRATPELMADKDVLDLLIHQHVMMAALFDEAERSVGLARELAFGRLVRLLSVHESAEEEIVHPYARLKLRQSDMVDRRLEEERQAKLLLAHLEWMGPDHPEFLRNLRSLRALIVAHTGAEEREEFPALRARTAESERRAMAAAVKVAEAMGPTHPHPGLESAAKSLLLGRPIAIVDRTLDLFRKATGKRA